MKKEFKILVAVVLLTLSLGSVVLADITTIRHGSPAAAATTCTPGSFRYGEGKLFVCYTTNKFKMYSSSRW